MNVKKKISLIGASGFIGSRLISVIQQDDDHVELVNLDKAESKEYPDITQIGDIRNMNSIENCVLDDSILIHLAAEHRDDVTPQKLYYEVNVDGTRNICEVAVKKNIKFIIFLSSVAVYGHSNLSQNEGTLPYPNNDYGASKLEAEHILRKWQNEDEKGRTLVIIRPTVIFGEKNRGNIFNLMHQLAARKFVMIGRGDNKKSIAYVGNLCSFIKYCIDNVKSGFHLYNYVDKPDLTMKDLVDSINKLLGHENRFKLQIPVFIALWMASIIDIYSKLSRKKQIISAIRIKKFCANSIYSTKIFDETKFKVPTELNRALLRTIRYEFPNK